MPIGIIFTIVTFSTVMNYGRTVTMPRSLHRSGGRYLKARREMFATYGDTCWLCGHPGATDADHIVAVSLAPDQPVDADGLRPAHGVHGCPTCGRRCNQERGNRQVSFSKAHFAW